MINDIRSRIITSCTEIGSGQKTSFDMGKVLENLLLFDCFILESTRLEEIPALIKVFGLEGLRELLKSGSLKIYCEALTTGQIGQTALESRIRKGVLPLGSYSFVIVKSADERQYIHNCFKIVEQIDQLNEKQKIKLKGLVAGYLVKHPPNAGDEILSQLERDLTNNDPSLRLSLAKVINIRKGLVIDINQLKMHVHPIAKGDFKIETNLRELLGIDELEAHRLVETAVLGIGGRNQRILDMKNFNALTEFRDNEVSIFESKLDFLSKQLEPKKPLSSLRRVMEISDFPNLREAISETKIDINKFFKIRQSDECKEFRSWLWSIDNASDEEIKEYVAGFRHRVGELIRTPLAKSLRWIAGIGLSLIPGAGSFISSAVGALDSFILERVLPVKGPVVFLNQKLPTIFQKQRVS